MAFESDLGALQQRHSVKWARYGADIIPAWVAEMDLPLAPVIDDAITAALQRNDLGYPDDGAPAVIEAFTWWARSRWDWRPEPALMTTFPTVMRAIEHALRRCSQEGDGVIVQTPIYPPFLAAVPECDRVLLEEPLTTSFGIDLERMRNRVASTGAKVLLICNPHNPTGRVFTPTEMKGLGDIAREHGCVIISDEVHADLIYGSGRHIPMASVAPERTITVTSAAKSFNIAGLRCALAVCGSQELHDRLNENSVMARDGVGILGLEATAAAWSHRGALWLAECMEHLSRRRQQVMAELEDLLVIPPEATYLAWLDTRHVAKDPCAFYLERAKVALSDGAIFGEPGRGFVRLNFATTEALLGEICRRLQDASPAR
jgi:cystathionine beta-lyase